MASALGFNQSQMMTPSPDAPGLLCHGNIPSCLLKHSGYILMPEIQLLSSAQILLVTKSRQCLVQCFLAAAAHCVVKCFL